MISTFAALCVLLLWFVSCVMLATPTAVLVWYANEYRFRKMDRITYVCFGLLSLGSALSLINMLWFTNLVFFRL